MLYWVVILVGFIYFQSEINGLRTHKLPVSPTSSTPTPTAIPTPTPTQTITPEPTPTITPLPSATTSTTYGGTTLVCTGSLSLGNDGGPVLNVDATITNIGNATTYDVSLGIQTYFPNGTKAIDCVKKLDDSNQYPPFPGDPWLPVNLSPGQSYTIG